MNEKLVYFSLTVGKYLFGGAAVFFQYLFLSPLFPQMPSLLQKEDLSISYFLLGLVSAAIMMVIDNQKGVVKEKLGTSLNQQISAKDYLYSTRVDPWIGIALGSVLCGLIYLTVYSMGTTTPDGQGTFGLTLQKKISNRGVIPFITVYFFSIVVIICLLKIIKAYTIRRLLNNYSGELVRTGGYIGPKGSSKDFIALRSEMSVSENNMRDEYFADLDREELVTSFTFTQFLLWAIPILGFVGTVWGISESIGGFTNAFRSSGSEGLNPEALNPSLNYLAIAFDTTLIALILGIVAMFISTFTKRFEDHLLLGYHLFISKGVSVGKKVVEDSEGSIEADSHRVSDESDSFDEFPSNNNPMTNE